MRIVRGVSRRGPDETSSRVQRRGAGGSGPPRTPSLTCLSRGRPPAAHHADVVAEIVELLHLSPSVAISLSNAPPGSFTTLAASGTAEIRVRASRFLAIAFPTADEEDARRVLREREREFFDARHHCAAWRFHGGAWRAIDAGEPSGSAGAPILAAIDAASLADVGVVVTRYFGGTKLGVGNLARAYGDAAGAALDAAPRRTVVPATLVEVAYPFSMTAAVMRAIERFSAADVTHGFSDAGEAGSVRFAVPSAELRDLRELLTESTAGAVTAEPIGETAIHLDRSAE